MSSGFQEALMYVDNVLEYSQKETSSETTSNQSSTLEGGLVRGMNISSGSFLPPQVGSCYADPAMEPSPSKKTPQDAYTEKASKMRPSLLPVEARIAGIRAMEFGAGKYGPEQWRTANITRTDIINALERHLLAYLQGERLAPDSQVEHLGHIIANCAILLARFDKEQP